MGKADDTRSAAYFLGIGVGTYDAPERFPPLPAALAEVKELAGLLQNRGYQQEVVLDPTELEAVAAIRRCLPVNSIRRDGALIVFWSGHGEPHEAGLSLILRDAPPTAGRTPILTPALLLGTAADSGAGVILVILDTCFAGIGALPALDVADRILTAARLACGAGVWVGLVASALALEPARDGAFGTALLNLLRNGPHDPVNTTRWSQFQGRVRATDLIDALTSECRLPDQTPNSAIRQFGSPPDPDGWFILPNPRFDPDAELRPPASLVLAAHGAAAGEEGDWFSDRVDMIARIVDWLRADRPGALVITGPAGSGKSAIAGRIATLSDHGTRADLCALGPLHHADPGADTIAVALEARGLDLTGLVRRLDAALIRRGLLSPLPDGPRNGYELIGALQRREASGQAPPAIIIDGLDEAGAGAFEIAEACLRLLAEHCLLLITTRDLPASEGDLTLVATLGTDQVIDLGEPALAAESAAAVHAYLSKRLATRAPGLAPMLVSDALTRQTSAGTTSPFLLARLLTTELHERPVDPAAADLQAQLGERLDHALTLELARLPVLLRDGAPLPQAARELMTALAWGYGSGLPDDLWALAATALSPTATTYHRDDCHSLLGVASQWIVVGGEEHCAVYRLQERRLAALLRPAAPVADLVVSGDSAAVRLAEALLGRYEALLAAGQAPAAHPYLHRYGWRHAVDAGVAGIAALRRLGTRAPELKAQLAAALNDLGVHHGELGQTAAGSAAITEAVGLYRALAATTPRWQADLARALNNLGSQQAAAGEAAAALDAVTESVAIRRALSAENPVFRADLARALNNLGNRLSEAGRPVEALDATVEALAIRRDLAAANPAFRADLASTLTNLGNRLSNLGRDREALEPAGEAVALYRELASAQPLLRPALATALDNLGSRLGTLGRHREGIELTTEALSLRRTLAAGNPALRAHLAGTLANLGQHQEALGQWQQAVATTSEAVGLLREVAAENRAREPDLARALLARANAQRLQEPEAALTATREAVDLLFRHAAESPALGQELGRALSALGSRYAGIGRHSDALAPAEQALAWLRPLAASGPAARAALADARNGLANRYRELARHPEAAEQVDEAVRLLRDLDMGEPARQLQLAQTLNTQGVCHGQVGRHTQAQAATDEAVARYRDLVGSYPACRPELARALLNQGAHRSASGEIEAAIVPAAEAVDLYRQVVGARPDLTSDLAAAESNLGALYTDLGRPQQALPHAEAAVRIYRGLASAGPRHQLDEARALSNLGACLGAAGRHREAHEQVIAATALVRPLSRANPSLEPLLHDLEAHLAERRRLDPGVATSPVHADTPAGGGKL